MWPAPHQTPGARVLLQPSRSTNTLAHDRCANLARDALALRGEPWTDGPRPAGMNEPAFREEKPVPVGDASGTLRISKTKKWPKERRRPRRHKVKTIIKCCDSCGGHDLHAPFSRSNSKICHDSLAVFCVSQNRSPPEKQGLGFYRTKHASSQGRFL